MPESAPIDDMPEPTEFDEEMEQPDYESPYPIDDRHLMDSIYNVVASHGDAMDEMYSSYKTAKLIAGLIISTILAGLFAVLLLTMAGVI